MEQKWYLFFGVFQFEEKKMVKEKMKNLKL